MTRLQKSSSSFCKRLMTYFPIQRIENFTISMVRTGALLRRAAERRRLPGMVVMKAPEDGRAAREHAPVVSTSTILISVAFDRPEPDPAASTSLKRCSVVVEDRKS